MKHVAIRKFNKRLILSGKILEIYDYEKPIAKGFETKRAGRANSPFTSSEVKNENRGKVARRARSYVRRMVNANPQLNKFLTLTFAENLTDLELARYEFDKFLKRLKTRFNGFQFVLVVEFQKRGAIHFHLLCNLPFVNVQELAKIWRHGFIRLNRIDNVDNVGAYITKYMTKDSIDERLIGKKCYSMSKGLNKPKEYTDEKDISEVLKNLETVKRIYTSEFESDYYGKVTYTQIICAVLPKAPHKIHRLLNALKAALIPFPDCTPTPFD